MLRYRTAYPINIVKSFISRQVTSRSTEIIHILFQMSNPQAWRAFPMPITRVHCWVTKPATLRNHNTLCRGQVKPHTMHWLWTTVKCIKPYTKQKTHTSMQTYLAGLCKTPIYSDIGYKKWLQYSTKFCNEVHSQWHKVEVCIPRSLICKTLHMFNPKSVCMHKS